MLAVAQLIERLIVAQVVAGLSPVSQPKHLENGRIQRHYDQIYLYNQ